jgi:prepilin-type N-terminal cleavage/methylation domain-containing protein
MRRKKKIKNHIILGETRMKSKKGFTLVELMVVVVIVALLAALLIPMLTARVEAARWSEGKAAAGTIATALRAYIIERAELEPGGVASVGSIVIEDFMNPADLTGKYFQAGDYSIADGSVSYTPGNDVAGTYVVTYTINVDQGSMDSSITWTKQGYTLDHLGKWTEVTTP